MATKKTGGSGGKSIPLDPKIADRLLDLLSENNDFRRLFKKDPRAAFIKAGMHPVRDASTLDAIAACCQVERIAPKATIIKSREALKQFLTAGLGMTPVQLDAGTATRSRR